MITINDISNIYKAGTPILIDDMYDVFNLSKETIQKSLSLLVKSGKLERFSRGVYYIPMDSRFGKYVLSTDKVIEKKYIGSKDNIFGMVSGKVLLNTLGLSTQVPNVVEIITNKETNIKREVKIGNQKVILRKAAVPIDSTNVELLKVLEALKEMEDINTEELKILSSIVKAKKYNRVDLDKILVKYPRKIYKSLVESGLIYEFAS